MLKIIGYFFSILLLLAFGIIGICYIAYEKAPVLSLKDKFKYTPIGTTKERIAGLKAPTYVPVSQVPKYTIEIMLLSEDSMFYEHNGFDFFELRKAVENYTAKGKKLRGASTISQQLMKNIFFDQDRSYMRKILEAFYTVKLEKHFSKREILSLYISNIQWGKNIYGIREASRYYFNKSPSELSLVDSCFLAAIIPNPIKYSSSFHRKKFTPFMKKRLIQIINLLYKSHRIDSKEDYLAEIDQFFMGFGVDEDNSEEEQEQESLRDQSPPSFSEDPENNA